MLRVLIDVCLLIAVAGAAFGMGHLAGARRASARIAGSLHDPDVGIPVMEDLARRFGAKLERQEGPGTS